MVKDSGVEGPDICSDLAEAKIEEKWIRFGNIVTFDASV